MLQVKVQVGVHLDHTQQISESQGVRVGDHLLRVGLHEGSGGEGGVLKRRQEEEQLSTKKKQIIEQIYR